jgi:hypothetical protein
MDNSPATQGIAAYEKDEENAPPASSGWTQSAAASGAASDAPLSNRASDRCREDEFLVVWRGIDSLELSFCGKLDGERASELAALKALAQDRDPEKQAAALLSLCGHVFQVHDRGARRYPFIVHDHRFFIKVKSHGSKFLPLAVAQIRSKYLLHRGIESAVNDLGEVVAALGNVEGDAVVSRVDLAVDFVSPVNMAAWDATAWVTRAERKDAHTVGEQFTGWSVGLGGPISARLYEKTIEIATRSKKFYLHELWKQAGWFPADPVWRFEVQFRRQVLAQLSLATLADVLRTLGGLWAYATTRWLRLTVPDAADSTRARWPLHPLWERIASVAWSDTAEALTRSYDSNNAPSEKAIARAGTSVLTTVMAREGIADPEKGFMALLGKVMRYWDKQAEWEGVSAERLILTRALAKERKFGIHTLAHKLGLVPPERSLAREFGEDE